MKIDIIGQGNVGSHLAKALGDKADTVSVNSRTLAGLRADADLYLISVSDDAIANVAKKLKQKVNKNGIVAHTSGTTPLSSLKILSNPTGVFYPLQTFTKGIELDYAEIPFFIEAADKRTEDFLMDTARLISRNVRVADSVRRRELHVASVFCCNFSNHLWALAAGWLNERGLDFKTLLPLIKETTRKAGNGRPFENQTGPAVRHDQGVLNAHLQALEMDPELQDIYSLLSLSIMNHHPNK